MSFKSWDSIDRNIIVGISLGIAEISETYLRAVVLERLSPQFNSDGDEVFPEIVALEKIELLGVPGAAVLATMGNELEHADGVIEEGFATIAEADGTKIPLIIMHGACDDDSTLKHEKIHLCQFLNPDRWPTAADMAEIAGADLQILDGGEFLLSLAADLCRHLISELEAYRFSDELAEETSVCDSILKGARSSTSPFASAKNLSIEYFGASSDALDYLEKLIDRFCDRIAETLPWVGCLVRNSSFSSLGEALRIQDAESCRNSLEDFESTAVDEPCPKCGSKETENCGNVAEYRNMLLSRCYECRTLFCFVCRSPVGDEGPDAFFPEVCPVCGSDNNECPVEKYMDSDGEFPTCRTEVHCSGCGRTYCSTCGAVRRD